MTTTTAMLRRQQEQQRLLDQALRHGSYLWTDRDVENALLWFQPLASSGSDAAADEQHLQQQVDEGCEFLRRLLRAPGGSICLPRPKAPNSTRKRKKSSLSGAKSHEHEHDGRSSNEGGHPPSKTKDGTTRLNEDEDQSSPLQSVLLGYYQQFLASPNNTDPSRTLKINSNNEEEDHELGSGLNDCHFTATDIHHAEMASSRLLTDLNSIITARKQANDIYTAYINVVTRENAMDTDATTTERPGDSTMSSAIDEYMTRPTTCTRRVYASSIYDRLLNLCRKNNGAENYNATRLFESESGDNPEIQRLVTKLFRLASTNVNIQEVILLVLLEPVRRLECIQKQQCNSTSAPPIPLSTSLWRHVSAETIEKACTSYPLPLIIQSILTTGPRSAAHNFLGDTSLVSTTSSLLASEASTTREEGMNSSQSILWWTLPSPLICTISQLYFPIACMYIQYWIERAVIGHEKLYEASPTGDGQVVNSGEMDPIVIRRNRNLNNNVEEPFFHAIRRIEQFSSTSDRLNYLRDRSLQSMEKESSSLTMSISSYEDENSAFRRLLAWKAVHRALKK